MAEQVADYAVAGLMTGAARAPRPGGREEDGAAEATAATPAPDNSASE